MLAFAESPVCAREWTPARGMAKSLVVGGAAATGLAMVLYALAYVAPVLTLNFALRTAFSFAVAWLLFRVVQDAAGMVGWWSTGLTLVLTAGVFLATHAAYAAAGVPTGGRGNLPAMVDGYEAWFNPWTLLMCNLSTCVGAGVCAWREHDG